MTQPAPCIRHKQMHPNGELLSITINTKDSLQYTQYQTVRRITYATRVYYNIVQLLKQIGEVSLYPEISKTGRLHYHGTIKLVDSFEFYIHIIPLIKEVANMDIDTIADPEIWEQYYTKDRLIMLEGMRQYDIPYVLDNDTNIKRWNRDVIKLIFRPGPTIEKKERIYRISILDFIEYQEFI